MWVLTNDDHINFRLAKATLADPGAWETVIAGSDDFYLTDFQLFRDFLVTEGRLNGLDQIALRTYDAPTAAKPIAFPEASYTAGLSKQSRICDGEAAAVLPEHGHARHGL